MAGVRKEGILLVDDVGGDSGVPVEISGPLGSQVAADSVSVAIASDQLPLPITGTIEVAVGAVDQGDPNTVDNGWPVKVTDGTLVVDVRTITDGDGNSVNGLITNSLIYGESTAGGGSYERVKVSPSGAIQVGGEVSIVDGINTANVNNDGQLDVAAWPPTDQTANGTITALNEYVTIPNISGYNSVTVEIPAGATLVGTLKFAIGLAPDVINYCYAFDTLNNKWVDSITDVSTLNTWRIPGVSGYDIFVICTDYTSGSVDVFLSITTAIINNPGLTEEELRSAPLEVKTGVDALNSSLTADNPWFPIAGVLDGSWSLFGLADEVPLDTDTGVVVRTAGPNTINYLNGTAEIVALDLTTSDTPTITNLEGYSSVMVQAVGTSATGIRQYQPQVSYNGSTWIGVPVLRGTGAGTTSSVSSVSPTVSLQGNATVVFFVNLPPGVISLRLAPISATASGTVDITFVPTTSNYLMPMQPIAAKQNTLAPTTNNYLVDTLEFATDAPSASDNGLITRQVGMPAAAALADNTSNPTLTKIQTFPSVFDGSTWDRMPGNSTDGVLVNLGANNDVTLTKAATGTQTQVPDDASSVTILAANSNRLGATILNTSTVTLYLRLSSSAATTSNYTVALVAAAYYEVPFWYSGQITGIWASDPGTGNANVTELT